MIALALSTLDAELQSPLGPCPKSILQILISMIRTSNIWLRTQIDFDKCTFLESPAEDVL